MRTDLGPLYNGWQVLDATPQEKSQGNPLVALLTTPFSGFQPMSWPLNSGHWWTAARESPSSALHLRKARLMELKQKYFQNRLPVPISLGSGCSLDEWLPCAPATVVTAVEALACARQPGKDATLCKQ